MALTLGSKFFRTRLRACANACGKLLSACCLSSKRKQAAIEAAKCNCNPAAVANPVVFYDQMNNYQPNWTPDFETNVTAGIVVQNPDGKTGVVELRSPSSVLLPLPGPGVVSISAQSHAVTPATTPFCFCFKIQQNSPGRKNSGYFAGLLSVVPTNGLLAKQIGIISYTPNPNFHLHVVEPAVQDFDLGVPFDNAQHKFTVSKIINGLSVQVDDGAVQLFPVVLTNIGSLYPVVAIRAQPVAPPVSVYLDEFRLSHA